MTETVIENRLAEYVGEIAAQRKTGAATEHSYRPALQRLLADAIPRATIVNEPARIECGAPDKSIIAALVEMRRLMDELKEMTKEEAT